MLPNTYLILRRCSKSYVQQTVTYLFMPSSYFEGVNLQENIYYFYFFPRSSEGFQLYMKTTFLYDHSCQE